MRDIYEQIKAVRRDECATCRHPGSAHVCHFTHTACIICGCRDFVPEGSMASTDDEGGAA